MATVSKDGTYRLYDTKSNKLYNDIFVIYFLKFCYIYIDYYINMFIVEFEKGEDPHVLQTVQWENTTIANIMLSPNSEVLVISHGSSLSFYSTITGLLDTTIEDIFLGIFSIL